MFPFIHCLKNLHRGKWLSRNIVRLVYRIGVILSFVCVGEKEEEEEEKKKLIIS